MIKVSFATYAFSYIFSNLACILPLYLLFNTLASILLLLSINIIFAILDFSYFLLF